MFFPVTDSSFVPLSGSGFLSQCLTMAPLRYSLLNSSVCWERHERETSRMSSWSAAMKKMSSATWFQTWGLTTDFQNAKHTLKLFASLSLWYFFCPAECSCSCSCSAELYLELSPLLFYVRAQTLFLQQRHYICVCMQTSVTNTLCQGGGQLLQCSALYMPILSVFVRSYWGRKWVEHKERRRLNR